ncbi:hypothetical protein FF011L_22510 [Roseimaritima multifibrata]|uniref:DUF1559 domain-containing protein n=1 Tax=Roseimaritima multifibrata TaxID=1930274 RepID=A0A517MF21_9BACT|nr:DUF1559 domain-containing protein [Roseimaritima multifibrata]QDS93481.1 hypothetical protein FF011L_22510 [Roseimaritima multifibrata]
MHEDLLGYLLNALEPLEMRRVEAALQASPELRAELARLKAAMEPLEEDTSPTVFQPPSDLISKTMAGIPPLSGTPAHSDGDLESSETTDKPNTSGPTTSRISALGKAHLAQSDRFRWSDVIASGVAAVVLVSLVLPSILNRRYEARKISCQDNLRRIGVAVTNYALSDPRQQLPALKAEGPEAFAGIYAVRLHEAGLIDSRSLLWCPSLDRPNWLGQSIPTVTQLAASSSPQLAALQRDSGGSYGFSLGVMDGKVYRPAKYQGRSSFAILGDVPMKDQQSDSEGLSGGNYGHEAKGVNLLFEDGRVQFMRREDAVLTKDHPFLNHRGQIAAGINLNDATLAPSWQPPFLDARQQ